MVGDPCLELREARVCRICKMFKAKCTKPKLPNQTYETKHIKPNLPNQTYQIKPIKHNLPNQYFQTKQTNMNLISSICDHWNFNAKSNSMLFYVKEVTWLKERLHDFLNC